MEYKFYTKIMEPMRKNRNEQTSQIARVCCEMLSDRKIVLTKAKQEEIIAEAKRQEQEGGIIKVLVNRDLLLLIFLKKLGSALIDIPESPDHKIIIAADKKSVAQYLVRNQRADRKHCEIFTLQNMLVNIMKHRYQPKFEWLSPDEKKELLKRLRTKAKNLPKICVDDPVARWYMKKIGDVAKVTRSNPILGKEITYKVVSGNHSHEVFCSKK
jgi:DNA-directed RNA polymerase subunit H (RpoH/RPB5)